MDFQKILPFKSYGVKKPRDRPLPTCYYSQGLRGIVRACAVRAYCRASLNQIPPRVLHFSAIDLAHSYYVGSMSYVSLLEVVDLLVEWLSLSVPYLSVKHSSDHK